MSGRFHSRLALLAGILTACGGAKSPLVDGGMPDSGSMDSGMPDAGSCDVDAIAEALAGDAGTDCGSFVARLTYMVTLDTGWSGGIDCALSAQDAGLPFRLHLTFAGADSDSISVFVRSPAGQSLELSDGEHLPFGSTSTVGQEGCSSFSLTTYEGIPIADGGIPDLACDSAGSGTVVCTYIFEL
jgi:hypothetical protein